MYTGIISSTKIGMLSTNSAQLTGIKDFSLLIGNFHQSPNINSNESVNKQEKMTSTSLNELLSLLNSTEISEGIDTKEKDGNIHKHTDLLMSLSSLLTSNDSDEIDFTSFDMEMDQFLSESFSKVENKLIEFFQGFQIDGTENSLSEQSTLPNTVKALKIIEVLGKEEDKFAQQTKVEDTVKELSNFVQAIISKIDKIDIQNDHLSREQVSGSNSLMVNDSQKNIAPVFFKKYNHTLTKNNGIQLDSNTTTSVPLNTNQGVQKQNVSETVFDLPPINEQIIRAQSDQVFSQPEYGTIDNDGKLSDSNKSNTNMARPESISIEVEETLIGVMEKGTQVPTTAESVIDSNENIVVPLPVSENETIGMEAVYNRITTANNTKPIIIPDKELTQISEEDNNSLIEGEIRQQTNPNRIFDQGETFIPNKPILENNQNNHEEMSLLDRDKNNSTEQNSHTLARIFTTQTNNDILSPAFANESNLKMVKDDAIEITMQEQLMKEKSELPLTQRATSEFVITNPSSKEATFTLPILASKLAVSFTSKETNLAMKSADGTQSDTNKSSVHSNKDIKSILTSFISKLNDQDNAKDKPITVVNKLVNPIMVESLRKKLGEHNATEPIKVIQPSINENSDIETKSSLTVGQLQPTAFAKVKSLVLATPTGAPIATDQIQEQVESILKNSTFTRIGDSQKMVIRLTPEHLGSLKIELIQNEGNLVAKIMTETAEAKEKLETHLSSLKHGLTSQNITVDKIEISYNPSQQERLNKEQQQQQQENLPERKHKETKEEEQQNETTFLDELLNQEI